MILLTRRDAGRTIFASKASASRRTAREYSNSARKRTSDNRQHTKQAGVVAKRPALPLVRDEEAAMGSAWDMRGIDDPLTPAAGSSAAVQTFCGFMSAGRL
jgi:hypothetical protein